MKPCISMKDFKIEQKTKRRFLDNIPEPNSARIFMTERIPNTKQILSKGISLDRTIMNKGKRAKKCKLSKIMNRVVESKEMLLDRGFTSTLLQTEDIHLQRREIEMRQRDEMLIEWAQEKVREVKSGNFVPPAVRDVVDKNIRNDLIKGKKKIEREKKKLRMMQTQELRRKGKYLQLNKKIYSNSKGCYENEDDFDKLVHLGAGISTMKHIQGEFPIKSSWPKGWKFKDYPKRDDDSPPIVEEVKEIPSPDPLIKVRNFHKKYARIATPPDKSETTRYISSHKVPNKPMIEEPPPPIHKYIETEKGKLLDTMGKQAKKRAELRTINTITEF